MEDLKSLFNPVGGSQAHVTHFVYSMENFLIHYGMVIMFYVDAFRP